MTPRNLDLDLLDGQFAVALLPFDADVPAWACEGELISICRSADELSVLCAEQAVPPEVEAERGFRALRVRGPLAFQEIGVLAALLEPLAEAGVSVFVLSSYRTDSVLVREETLARAVGALADAGHRVHGR